VSDHHVAPMMDWCANQSAQGPHVSQVDEHEIIGGRVNLKDRLVKGQQSLCREVVDGLNEVPSNPLQPLDQANYLRLSPSLDVVERVNFEEARELFVISMSHDNVISALPTSSVGGSHDGFPIPKGSRVAVDFDVNIHRHPGCGDDRWKVWSSEGLRGATEDVHLGVSLNQDLESRLRSNKKEERNQEMEEKKKKNKKKKKKKKKKEKSKKR